MILAGTQSIGTTFNSDQSQLVYAVGTKDVTSITISTKKWEKDATLLDRDAYNYSKVTALNTKDFTGKFLAEEIFQYNIKLENCEKLI